jgi:hypothetical protein
MTRKHPGKFWTHSHVSFWMRHTKFFQKGVCMWLGVPGGLMVLGRGTSGPWALVPSVFALSLPSFPRAGWPNLSIGEKASCPKPASCFSDLTWVDGDRYTEMASPCPHPHWLAREADPSLYVVPCSYIVGFCMTWRSRLGVPGGVWSTQQMPGMVCKRNQLDVPFPLWAPVPITGGSRITWLLKYSH